MQQLILVTRIRPRLQEIYMKILSVLRGNVNMLGSWVVG